MEQFAIWNLLKTMLNNSPSPSLQAAKTAENQAEYPSNSTKSATADTHPSDANAAPEQAPSETPRSSANACEEYLLRHERLTSGRKR